MEEYAIEADFQEKDGDNKGGKGRFVRFLESPWWNLSIIILVAIIAFTLGRISAISGDKEPVRVVQDDNQQTTDNSRQTGDQTYRGDSSMQGAAVIQSEPSQGEASGKTQVVASKNGSKYHLPTCPGAKQISEKNKITFTSIEEARAAGYTPAANCKGLK